jgi:drug/metabolite transporter (DMT)-like permease
VFELWVPLTLVAAFFQNARSALQKSIKSELSNSGATYVRFAFGIPFALLYLVGLVVGLDQPVPIPGRMFFLYGGMGGLAQILATAALLYAVSFRSFAVGTAYSKTEPVQAAIFGFLLLGESVGQMAGVALLLSLAGVVALGLARSDVLESGRLNSLFDRGALMGLAAGALFGLASVCYRGASLSLETGSGAFLRASFTLASVIVFQTLAVTVYLGLREPGELRRVAKAWRAGLWVGACGALASASWFTAMSLQSAAYVKAVGQLELVFALGASWFFFREGIRPVEVAGIAAILVGVLLIVLGN